MNISKTNFVNFSFNLCWIKIWHGNICTENIIFIFNTCRITIIDESKKSENEIKDGCCSKTIFIHSFVYTITQPWCLSEEIIKWTEHESKKEKRNVTSEIAVKIWLYVKWQLEQKKNKWYAWIAIILILFIVIIKWTNKTSKK